MKIADLWIVTTSNNLGSVDDDTDLYPTEADAGAAAAAFNQARAHDRVDWIAIPLSKAIEEAISDASANAMDEG